MSAILLAFCALAGRSIWIATQDNFFLIEPGLLLNDSQTRFYMLMPYGTRSLYNVDVMLSDMDRFRAVGSDPSKKSMIDSLMATFHWNEIDLRAGGTPEMFDWKPLTPGHEHLEFDFQSRDVDFYETLTVETRGTMFSFPTSMPK